MFKGFEYNKDYRKMADRSVYAQEHKAFDEFLTTEHDNIRLEYGNKREAQNAAQALRKYVKDCRKPLKVVCRQHYVFAVRTIEE